VAGASARHGNELTPGGKKWQKVKDALSIATPKMVGFYLRSNSIEEDPKW
jgi:hypothetical protein